MGLIASKVPIFNFCFILSFLKHLSTSKIIFFNKSISLLKIISSKYLNIIAL